jgi:hypothetical protein
VYISAGAPPTSCKKYKYEEKNTRITHTVPGNQLPGVRLQQTEFVFFFTPHTGADVIATYIKNENIPQRKRTNNDLQLFLALKRKEVERTSDVKVCGRKS